MNAAPKVSVVIPVYNTEQYLRECLDSVVNQTLRDIEIICVDDGSTDGSPEILREYEAKDHRIIVLTQEKSNAGVARNLGLSIAVGEYLSFLDSDDFFELTMLEHMYACAKSRNADIVVCEMKVYYEDSGKAVPTSWHIRKDLLPAKTVFSFGDIKRDAFRCIISYVWDKLIRRDVVITNRLSFQSQPVFEDAVFVYKAMMSAEAITLIKEYLVYYRQRSSNDSITAHRYQYIDYTHSTLIELKEYLTSNGIYKRYHRDFISYAVSLIKHTLSGNMNGPDIEILKKVDLWLDEFEITGHKASYYYDLMKYQRLLQEIQANRADAEFANARRELNRLNNSLSCRISIMHGRISNMVRGGFRYLRANGLRHTLRRIREKLVER